jgi:membrane-bound metal-dependent hydrolase YbcI (DUF457 family)
VQPTDPPENAAGRVALALRLRSRHSTLLVLATILAACLPDVDFAWGRHNMETHSVGFALLVGALTLAAGCSPRVALACTLAVGSHVLFDWLGSDDFPPLGVMALWPFSREFYFAHAYVFATISRRYWLPGFVEHNVLAVLREVVLVLPLVAVAVVVRARGHRPRQPPLQRG